MVVDPQLSVTLAARLPETTRLSGLVEGFVTQRGLPSSVVFAWRTDASVRPPE